MGTQLTRMAGAQLIKNNAEEITATLKTVGAVCAARHSPTGGAVRTQIDAELNEVESHWTGDAWAFLFRARINLVTARARSPARPRRAETADRSQLLLRNSRRAKLSLIAASKTPVKYDTVFALFELARLLQERISSDPSNRVGVPRSVTARQT
jgi:hypothetical protein